MTECIHPADKQVMYIDPVEDYSPYWLCEACNKYVDRLTDREMQLYNQMRFMQMSFVRTKQINKEEGVNK